MIEFLNSNSGAITALAATIGTLVAIIYTFYTTKLWKTASEQARLCNDQVIIQKEQIAFNERTFSLINRPRIEITADFELVTELLSSLNAKDIVVVCARNHGAVSAKVSKVNCSFSQDGIGIWVPVQHSVVASPNDSCIVGKVIIHQSPKVWPWDPDHTPSALELHELFLFIHIDIEYLGIQSEVYTCSAMCLLGRNPNDTDRWMIYSTSPKDV